MYAYAVLMIIIRMCYFFHIIDCCLICSFSEGEVFDDKKPEWDENAPEAEDAKVQGE